MDRKSRNFEERTRFIDGSEYKGTWNALGIDGIGSFNLPHGAAFEGEFRDGTFHGHGSMYWPRGQTAHAIWIKGDCKSHKYVFHDGLVYDEIDWKYCKFPDRRYLTSIQCGLRPAGDTLRTNNRETLIIPPFCYDAGFGIYNPRTHCITSYRDSRKVLEIPNIGFAQWIKKNCQKAWSEPTGHREDLYENWFDPNFRESILSDLLPFSKSSPESWWKRLSTFDKDCSCG